MTEMVKVRSLNDVYLGMDSVSFPAIVSATIDGGLAEVPSSEMYRIGCDIDSFQDEKLWPFLIGTDCEIIND